MENKEIIHVPKITKPKLMKERQTNISSFSNTYSKKQNITSNSGRILIKQLHIYCFFLVINGNMTVVVLLDKSKIFDTVDHQAYLEKLYSKFSIAWQTNEFQVTYLKGHK